MDRTRSLRLRAGAVVLGCLIGAACGRVGFDGRPDALPDALVCVEPVVGGCDDGDPCTIDDICAYGTCSAGRRDTSNTCSTTPRVIHRSVGPTIAAPLATGAASSISVTIVGATAVFSSTVPDRVGVGDALQYDTNDDGVWDAIGFLSRRASSQVFEVHAANGSDPVPLAASMRWELHRAYVSLLDALDRGQENPLIASPVRDFDAWTEGVDLVAANQIWSVACYADGVDDAEVYVCTSDESRAVEGCTPGRGWRTSAATYLRVFTPTTTTEVGASQRHSGRWGDGYRRTKPVQMYPMDLRIEGFSQRIDAPSGSRSFIIYSTGLPGDVRITHTFAWMASAGGLARVFDVYSQAFTGPDVVRVRFANIIARSDSTSDPVGVFYMNSDQAVIDIYSATAIASAGPAFHTNAADVVACKNCLGIAPLGFSGNRWRSITTSVSGDDSVVVEAMASQTGDATTAFGSRAVTFVDEANADYHLAPSDVGARGVGANLAGDPVFAFGDDIDGDARPVLPLAWDVGADQVP
jgi:hypothetical protein